MHDCRMAESMLGRDGQIDAFIGISNTDNGHYGHHLFRPDNGMFPVNLDDNLPHFGPGCYTNLN